MVQRPKVLLVIPHLGGGGAERVTALLARSLSRQKYELHLCTVTDSSAGGEPPPAGVAVHALGASRVRSGALPLLRLVWRLKPDVILSSMYHLNFLVLLLRPFFPKATRVLVRQNGTVSSALAAEGRPRNSDLLTGLLYRALYCRADGVICQTKAMAKDLARELGIEGKRLTVLPNPVEIALIRDAVIRNSRATQLAPAQNQHIHQQLQWPGAGPHLLAVGRLSREKGFDLLLRALAAVRTQFPEVDLLIAGVGPEEARLMAERHALDLDSAARFVGHSARPWEYFPGATLFVLPSRHEGLPNALLEAAAGGVPIVALPASGGVVDLLRNQPGTWLATEISSDALAASLRTALLSLRPGERFAHAFIDEFKIDRATAAYERLIDATLFTTIPITRQLAEKQREKQK
jgi:glycosyltransferase involved in cell wall biosynthesis